MRLALNRGPAADGLYPSQRDSWRSDSGPDSTRSGPRRDVVLASMISVEIGLSVALIELGLGVVVGNLFSLDPEHRLARLHRHLRLDRAHLPCWRRGRSRTTSVSASAPRSRSGSSPSPGRSSSPGLIAYGLLGWDTKAALIAGTALSTTSLAVVYAVLVETGLNATRIGKLIMSACFVTDMATAIALSAIFITPNAWFPVFLVVSIAPDRSAPEDRAVVLPPLRRPGDRARDQAGLSSACSC